MSTIPPPQVVVLAGPNGAGKSTAAKRLISADTTFVNADEIAKTLTGDSPEQVNLRAGRIMLERLEELANARHDFALETTLSNRSLAGRLKTWQEIGYRFTLFFLMLPNADVAVARVKSRVASGGHDVPEETIRRRYRLGIKNFVKTYLPLADVWTLYDNTSVSGYKVVAEKAPGMSVIVTNESLWRYVQQSAADRADED